MNSFRHEKGIVCIETDIGDPTMYFKERHMPEDLTEYKEKIPSKQKMWEIKLKINIGRE